MKNLTIRILSSAIYAILMLAAMFVGKYVFAAVFLFIMCASMAEFYSITTGPDSYRCAKTLMIAAAVTLFAGEFCMRSYGLDHRFVGIAIIPAAASMISALLKHDKDTFLSYAFIATGLVYIGIPAALSNALVFDKSGQFSGLILLSIFMIIWASDIGAYVFGMAFGQKPNSKKLCPDISPKKSWIGFWGGLVFGVAALFLAKCIGIIDISLIHCIGLGTVTSVAGVFGDLFESMWKRSLDLKDSGNIIPGHGGMLDRFDSSLMAIPVAAVYIFAFNLL